ncbi:MAG TPA: cation:proton antiporter [Jatrophihabitans sp.]|nr:cation:proton antiporter [Jatrophihabitans sp.]
MSDSYAYGGLLLLIGVVGVVAVLSNRITQRTRIPAPALLLVATALAVQLVPNLHRPSEATVDHLVTIALVLILFDGGMHLGWPDFRRSARTIGIVGVAGTFLTAAGAAAIAHYALGLGWYPALLVATAVAPTDPAVVFSVLGQQEVVGRSGTVLEGESGANDPVGIALMASLLTAGHLSAGAFGQVAGQFALQMGIGALFGGIGGRLLLDFIRRVPLPNGGLYPVRTLGCILALFGVTVLAHGSGYLAVFVAGIVLGEARAPYKREIEHVHSAAASLGEIVAFVALGLTVDLGELASPDVWLAGLVLAVLLTVVVRPLLVGACLIGSELARNERLFVLLSGLKGAVPILLGSFLLTAKLPDTERLYGIVVIVVAFSVTVQATALPSLAHRLGVRMRPVEPEPWALGVRLRDEPAGVHRLTVAPGSAADGRSIAELVRLPEFAWISFVIRAGALVPVTGETVLEAGDDALILAEPDQAGPLAELFSRPAGG